MNNESHYVCNIGITSFDRASFIEFVHRKCASHSNDDNYMPRGMAVTSENLNEWMAGNKCEHGAPDNERYKTLSYFNADFSGLDLIDLDFSMQDLWHVDFSRSSIRNCTFSRATMYNAIFSGAGIQNSNFSRSVLGSSIFDDAKIYNSDFSSSILRRSSLYNAEFINVNLANANLSFANTLTMRINLGTDLTDAIIGGTTLCSACPETGSFDAWKKVLCHDGEHLVKLRIPEDAARSSGTTRKCRCSKANVTDIIYIKTGEHRESVVNIRQDVHTVYTVGSTVYPDSFDDNRWNECSNGIHFFMSREEAMEY